MSSITRWGLGLPDAWGGWPTQGSVCPADAVASRLTENARAAERVRHAVLQIHESVAVTGAAHVGAAIWVPDPSSGDVYAGMVATLTDRRRDDGAPGLVGPDEYREMVKERPRREGTKVFHRSVDRTQVSAGAAVVVVETTADRFTGREVVSTARWTVFPGDAVDAVELEFSTLIPAVSEEVVDVAALVATTLRVELGPRVEVRPIEVRPLEDRRPLEDLA